MEQTLPLSGASVSRSVRVRQIAAAILLSLAIVWSNYLTPWGYLLYVKGLWMVANSEFYSHSVYTVLTFILCISAILLLLPIVSNRPTKTAIWIGTFNFLWVAIFRIISVTFTELMSPLVERFFWGLYTFIYCYWLSLIIRNNRLTKISVSWIGIWVVFFMRETFYYFMNIWFNGTITPFATSFCAVFSIGIDVFLFISFFKFTHCAAFSGGFDPAPVQKNAYSPLNKYVLGMFVTSSVVIAALWAYYKYVAPLLENL